MSIICKSYTVWWPVVAWKNSIPAAAVIIFIKAGKCISLVSCTYAMSLVRLWLISCLHRDWVSEVVKCSTISNLTWAVFEVWSPELLLCRCCHLPTSYVCWNISRISLERFLDLSQFSFGGEKKERRFNIKSRKVEVRIRPEVDELLNMHAIASVA